MLDKDARIKNIRERFRICNENIEFNKKDIEQEIILLREYLNQGNFKMALRYGRNIWELTQSLNELSQHKEVYENILKSTNEK